MTKNNNQCDAAVNYASIQQAYKKNPGEEKKPVSFTTPIQAVYDGKTGASLEAILAQFNSIYVQYQGSPKDTRLIIPKEMRRAGLTITYMDMESNTITERANSAVQKDNDHWALDVNWSRVDELSLSGDISVSAAGTWIINGKDTGVKALGPKGDTGLTPWLKTIENRLHFSYDNITWEPCSENIAAWFRWSGNKIQISRDNKTWTDLSGKFADNVHIKGYVAATDALPSGADQGDIYGVGPTYAAEDTAHTNPIYRYYVRNANAWVDNGSFTSIAAGVVQETGDSETEVMSQKAVTEKLFELGQGTKYILDSNIECYYNGNSVVVAQNIDYKGIILPVKEGDVIEAFLNIKNNGISYAIAFFQDDPLNTPSFISGIKSNNDGNNIYKATVPVGSKYVVVSSYNELLNPFVFNRNENVLINEYENKSTIYPLSESVEVYYSNGIRITNKSTSWIGKIFSINEGEKVTAKIGSNNTISYVLSFWNKDPLLGESGFICGFVAPKHDESLETISRIAPKGSKYAMVTSLGRVSGIGYKTYNTEKRIDDIVGNYALIDGIEVYSIDDKAYFASANDSYLGCVIKCSEGDNIISFSRINNNGYNYAISFWNEYPITGGKILSGIKANEASDNILYKYSLIAPPNTKYAVVSSFKDSGAIAYINTSLTEIASKLNNINLGSEIEGIVSIADLPVSTDGVGLNVGDAYIESNTNYIKVKL